MGVLSPNMEFEIHSKVGTNISPQKIIVTLERILLICCSEQDNEAIRQVSCHLGTTELGAGTHEIQQVVHSMQYIS